MVGRWLSFWETLFSGVMLVSGRVISPDLPSPIYETVEAVGRLSKPLDQCQSSAGDLAASSRLLRGEEKTEGNGHLMVFVQVVPGRAGGGSFRRKKNYIAKKEFAYRMCARRPTSAMPKPFLCCERAFCCSMGEGGRFRTREKCRFKTRAKGRSETQS